tara:strand:+ start:101 stop:541 length:441 start_codon:yes stop_codon:yes gene_type:complete
MIKTIIRLIYSAFISIVLFSIVLAGWTSYSFVFQSSKSSQIAKVIQDIYSSQKSVFVNVIDLSKILIKDSSHEIINKNENLLSETESLADKEDDFQLYQSESIEDNGENPLGIVIQQTLPEVNDEIIEEPLANQKNEFSRNEMEMN